MHEGATGPLHLLHGTYLQDWPLRPEDDNRRVDPQLGGASRAFASRPMTTFDAVYTHDDDMAEGVVAAIENAGREDEMFLTGAGGSSAAMDRIAEGGLYRATFLHNPSMSASAIRLARLIVRGEGLSELAEPEVPSRIQVPATTVTKENVDAVRDLGFQLAGLDDGEGGPRGGRPSPAPDCFPWRARAIT